MYNEKDWEKNHEPLNGENDVDITEGSYVDGVHTGRSEDRSAGRRMYGQIRRPSEENTGCGTYQYGSGQSQEGRSESSWQKAENSGNQENGGDSHRSGKKGSRLAKKAAGIAAAGLLFGCVAGGTMAGINYLTGGSQTEKTEISAQAPTEAPQPETQAQAASGAVIQASTGNDVSAIVEKAMPSVVAINNKTLYTTEDWFFGTQQYEASSAGSGIIVGKSDTELLVVTNSHVIANAEEMNVTFIDGSSAAAALKGTDVDADLAVIAVQLSDIPAETLSQIKVAEMGDSDSLKLGNGVIAIGNALGEGQSVTVGYISALNKEVDIEGVTKNLIQVDAAINPGNSGGALLDMNGKLIGINEAKMASTEVEGVGYAIPISYAKDIIDDLMAKTTKVAVAEDEQGYLGIQIQDINSQMAKAYGMPEGIYVYKIVEGLAADGSGLRERDIITKVNGETVRTAEDLQKMLTYYKGGEIVTLTVQSLDNGAYAEREVQVTLGYRKDAEKNLQQTRRKEIFPQLPGEAGKISFLFSICCRKTENVRLNGYNFLNPERPQDC